MPIRSSVTSELRQAGGAVWLWLAVAGLWSTVSAAHESGFVLLIAAALLAAALPGTDRRLLTLAAIWTVLAGAVTWQPGLGLGTIGWSVAAVLALRLIAWPAWQQPGVLGSPGGGRAAAVAFVAGSVLYMFTDASPVASWGMFVASLVIGGVVWYFRRSPMWAGAAALAGGWLLNLAGDILITDQLWQGVLLGVRPGLAWAALAGSIASGSFLIGGAAALPQIGLDWPVRRQRPQDETRATAAAVGDPQRVQRGTIVWAVLFGLIAVLIPEFGATFVRVADGGVWAASLAWWGLGVLLDGVVPVRAQAGAAGERAGLKADLAGEAAGRKAAVDGHARVEEGERGGSDGA